MLGILFALYVRSKLAEVNARQVKLSDRYTNHNALIFGCAITIQSFTGIDLIKQSADGLGDYALNFDLLAKHVSDHMIEAGYAPDAIGMKEYIKDHPRGSQ